MPDTIAIDQVSCGEPHEILSRRRQTKTIGAITITCVGSILFTPHALAQAATTTDIPSAEQKLRQYLLFSSQENLNLVLWHMCALVFAAILLILVVRTAIVKQNARFLWHLAGAYTVLAAAHAGKIITAFFKDRMATDGLIATLHQSSGFDSALNAITIIEATWQEIDMTLSFFSTFWLFLTWDLITQYPKEGISKQFYVLVTGLFVTAITLLALVVAAPVPGAEKSTYAVVEFLDAISSTAALGLIGVAFFGLYPPNCAIASPNSYWLLRYCAGCCYLVWGFVDLLWYYWSGQLMYLIILFFLGFVSVLITTIFCSLAMKDKPQYAAASDVAADNPGQQRKTSDDKSSSLAEKFENLLSRVSDLEKKVGAQAK